MEEKFKKESKFVDNVAYKNKFQFLVWVNDNVICQRYFKINGFNEELVYSEEFDKCMNGIVLSIQKDLESKSRIFMWYTNMSEPLKLNGFLSDNEFDKYDEEFLSIISNSAIQGKVTAPDGKVFTKEYLTYNENNTNEYGDNERPNDNEFVFKFSFLIDDKIVFEKVWDGNVYPKFVRNGVDLTNNYAFYNNKDISSLSFSAAIIRYMQRDKTNLINDFIRRICETLSNNYAYYNKNMSVYKNNNVIDEEKHKEAVEYYGGEIKPVITGHTDITPEDKKYTYLSAFETYKQSWKKSVFKKTQEYFSNFYPSNKQVEYFEKHC